MSESAGVLGPVEWVAIALPGDGGGAAVVPAMAGLVDAGLVRIVDLLIVARDSTGLVTTTELDDLGPAELSPFDVLDGDVLGLLNEDDIELIGADLPAGSSAVVVVWENRWAAGFAQAVRDAGGSLIAHDRIPHVDAVAALKAVDPVTT